VFDDDRYFDVYVEYAKASAEDILIRLTIINRSPEEATLDLLPTLWLRNVWSWESNASRPSLRRYQPAFAFPTHTIVEVMPTENTDDAHVGTGQYLHEHRQYSQ